MNNISFLVSLPVAILVVFNTLTVDTSRFPGRNVGDPIDTHWYLSEFSSGCFEEEAVFELKDHEIRIVISGPKKTIIMKAELIQNKGVRDGEVFIHTVKEKTASGVKISPKHTFTNYLDNGDHLIPISTHHLISGERFKTENSLDLYHCSSPTLWGKFLLGIGLKKMFNPKYKNGIYIDA